MSATLNLGTDGNWATKKDTILAYNDENSNFKPLPFSFDRASSATVINKAGLIETVGSGEPRIDFKDNTKGSLLLEPQRSNLQVYSEQFDNAAWTKTNLTVNTNQTISPNGELTADLLTTTSTVGSYVLDVAFVTSSQKYNYSVFVKKSNVNFFGFIIVDGANVVRQYYDINNGVVGSSVNTGTPIVENIKIENYGNGWYRCSLTIQALNSAVEFRSYVVESDGTSTAPIGSKIFLWGAQVEQGSYATSYIPTSGQANGVTRVADVCSQTVPNNIVSSNEGTFFIDMNSWQSGSYGSSAVSFGLYLNGSQSNAVGFTSNQTTNNLRARISDDTGSDYIGTNFTPSTRDKLAIKWNGTTVSFFKNGSLFYSLANTGGKSYDTISLPISARTGLFPINDVRVYNTALTDQELIALTTI